MYSIRKKLTVFCFLFYVVSSLTAQEMMIDDLGTADSLLNDSEWVQVKNYTTTVSKKKELTQSAPANITVITQEEIQNLGVNTLYEVLSYVPGITVNETYLGYTNVTFRGIAEDLYNHESLLLINGHPSFDVINFSYNLEIIPINSVKKIEIIRGPGSVLYGTNAYAGVINIITFDGDKNGLTLSAKGGDFKTEEISLSASYKRDDLNLYFAASDYNTDGYEAVFKQDEIGLGKTFDYKNDITNYFTKISFKNITFNAGYFKQEKDKAGFQPLIYTSGMNRFEGYFSDLQINHSLNDNMEFSLNFRYDGMEKEYDLLSALGGYESIPTKGHKYGSEFEINYEASDEINFTFGISWDKFDLDLDWQLLNISSLIGNIIIFYDGETYADEFSSYLNSSINLSDEFKVVTGIRYSDNSKAGEEFIPNLGLVYKLNDGTFLKFLYGEAYRSPNLYELVLSIPGLVMGNAELKNEKIRTFDIGVDMSLSDDLSFKGNIYYLETDDSIQSVFAPGEPYLIFDNVSGQEMYGIELDLRMKINPGIDIFLNGAYNDGEQDNGCDVPFLANYTFNGGINWSMNEFMSVHFNSQFVSEKENTAKTYSADAYTISNLQFVIYPCDGMTIRLMANNVFDEEYFYPEEIREVVGDLINGPEQAFYIKVDYNF